MAIQTICCDQNDLRLDVYIAQQVKTHSRAFLRNLIDQHAVLVQGKPVKASYRTSVGEIITVDLPDSVDLTIEAQAIPLTVRYEDDYLLVIDKPQGMVVHPAPGHHDGTLVNALLNYCHGSLSDLNGVRRPGIVHRIDKDTSGLLLVVKDNTVHREIADKIRRHEVRRTYQALVYGQVTSDHGTIDAPIGRDPKNRQKMAVVPSGKTAITHFRVIERLEHATWLEIELETGRTHQIRVHCLYIGHPIVNDPVYATNRVNYGHNGQALHASKLAFIHPATGQELVVESPLPEHFLSVLRKCR
ncbi:MAG: RluA family pseudouridine synthase [Eubacteriales bacterium]|nr:RluA family pseudouridine synthase [Eubacteriales bacterium]